jgi:hypothetical protein
MSNKKAEKEYDYFSEEVWDRLSRTDVTEHIDFIEATGKRPEISYLAWHTAWSLLKRKFPASTYNHEAEIRHPDGTVEVEVNVWIYSNDKKDCQMTNARLAVMDNWMNPIANPTARQVNDSRQRVLVKALAFAGLGLTLWSGDTMPIGEMEDPIDDDQLALITDLVERSDTNMKSFLKWADKIECLEEMTKERFPKARTLLEEKIKRNARNAKAIKESVTRNARVKK